MSCHVSFIILIQSTQSLPLGAYIQQVFYFPSTLLPTWLCDFLDVTVFPVGLERLEESVMKALGMASLF